MLSLLKKMMNLFMYEEKDKPVVEDMSGIPLSLTSDKAPSLICKEKAATLSQDVQPMMIVEIYGDHGAMGELRNVQRRVYEVQNKGNNDYVMYEQVSLPTISKILVVYSVEVESKSVKKSAVVEDMSGIPLSLTSDSVTDGNDFNDVQGEVLGKLQISLESFLLLESKVTYGMAEQKSVSKEHSVKSGTKKKGKLGRRRSLEICRRAASSNSCPGGVLEWQQVLANRLGYCVLIYISRPVMCVCHATDLVLYLLPIISCPPCPKHVSS